MGNVDAVMTDSPSKNWKIEHLIWEKLRSSHIPAHYLCDAHTSEEFDRMILSVLIDIESKISLREKLEASTLS